MAYVGFPLLDGEFFLAVINSLQLEPRADKANKWISQQDIRGQTNPIVSFFGHNFSYITSSSNIYIISVYFWRNVLIYVFIKYDHAPIKRYLSSQIVLLVKYSDPEGDFPSTSAKMQNKKTLSLNQHRSVSRRATTNIPGQQTNFHLAPEVVDSGLSNFLATSRRHLRIF